MDEGGRVSRTIREGVEIEVRVVFPNLHALAGTVSDQGVPLESGSVRLYLDSKTALDAEGWVGGNVSIPEYPDELTRTTGTDGKFRFDHLARGRYAISVERPTGGMRQLWDLTLPDRSASIDLQLDSLSVHGIVTDSEGLPVAGARLAVERVRVDELGSPSPVELVFAGQTLHRAGVTEIVESAADGSFRIDGVDGSSPLVVVARSPWMTTTRSQVFGFARDETEQEIDITLTPTGQVAVQVYADPRMIRFLRLRATPLEREGPSIISRRISASNQLKLDGLRPGSYVFELYLFVRANSSSIPRGLSTGSVRSDGTLADVELVEAEVVAGETLEFSLTVP